MTAERVLVVDDDEALLNLMVLSLRRRGYQVEQAIDGFSALKILSSQPPFSVLLTDMMMPGMSGLELLREARKLDKHIEVVVITAAYDLDSAISALRADGAYDYLLKPFESMSQLLLAVERAAAQRRLLLEREQLQVQIQSEAERLRALISNTGDAILSANADGILQIVNPAAAHLVGLNNLEGSPAFQTLPSNLVTLIKNWQAVGGNLPAVVETPWPDGSIQMVSLTPIPENGGAQWGWVAVLRDLTLAEHILTDAIAAAEAEDLDRLHRQILLAGAIRPFLQEVTTGLLPPKTALELDVFFEIMELLDHLYPEVLLSGEMHRAFRKTRQIIAEEIERTKVTGAATISEEDILLFIDKALSLRSREPHED